MHVPHFQVEAGAHRFNPARPLTLDARFWPSSRQKWGCTSLVADPVSISSLHPHHDRIYPCADLTEG